MIKFLYNLLLKNKQLIKYGIIGCCCAGLDFIVYWLLVHTVKMPYLYANIISVHCGIFASFFLNRYFTFQVKNKTLLRFFSFYVVGIIGLAISSGLLFLLVEKMALNELVSKAFTIIVVALIQFILNKYISFRDGK
jgi:putative flippase GtrA